MTSLVTIGLLKRGNVRPSCVNFAGRSRIAAKRTNSSKGVTFLTGPSMNGYFTSLVTSLILALLQAEEAKPPSVSKNLTRQGPVRTDLHGDPLPAGALSRIGTVRFRHANTILSVAYSPDGDTLAVSTHDGLHLWEVATGKHLLFFPVEAFYAMAFSPDGAALVGQTDTPKSKLYLWDLKSNKEKGPLPAPFVGPFSCFAFSPDNKTLALAKGSAVLLSERTTGKELKKLEGIKGQTGQLVFSRDAKLLTIKSQLVENNGRIDPKFFRDGGKLMEPKRRELVTVWDLATGTKLSSREFPHKEIELGSQEYEAMALMPDGLSIGDFTGDHSGGPASVRFLDIRTGKEARSFSLPRGTRAFRPSKDGRYWVLAGEKSLSLWDSNFGKEIWKSITEPPFAVDFSPDGKTLAGGIHTASSPIRLWEVRTGKHICIFPEHQYPSQLIALSPEGRTVITWDCQGEGSCPLRYWEASTGKELLSLPEHLHKFHFPAALSHDFNTIVTHGEKGELRLWDVPSGKHLRDLPHDDRNTGCAFSLDGKLLVSRHWVLDSSPKMLTRMDFWDVSTGKKLDTFDEEESLSFTLAFSSNGKLLAAGGSKDTICIWDVPGRKKTGIVLKAQSSPFHFAFSPDARILASSGLSHEIKLWEVSTGKELPSISNDQTKSKHERGTYALAFSPDGKTIATSDIEGGIYLWDVPSRRLRQECKGHFDRVMDFDFSSDGKVLASGGYDGTILVWDLSK
jgi:WD40 repeat protein